jgi:hypothetical protein
VTEGGGGIPVAPSEELSALRDHLDVFNRVSAYNVATQIVERPQTDEANHRYFVMTLDVKGGVIRATGFAEGDFQSAVREQGKREDEGIGSKDIDTVLVSVESVAELRKAYPNYFADTRDFIGLVYGRSPP